ncbi:plasmid stabilization system protein ParE [Oxalobacteraceae bacterium GrIS 2.11]
MLSDDKSVIWSVRAQKALISTLTHIKYEDEGTAAALLRRVENSTALLATQPGMGTSTATPGVRRYAIPHTGHTIEYRSSNGGIQILRWYRQRQQQKP